MLEQLGCRDLDDLVDKAIPSNIRWQGELQLPAACSEHEVMAELRAIGSRNQVLRSYIGMGYHATRTPAVIQRNILENPGWYTQYTPYQAEISQGRMEALLNFQTMVIELTGLEVANSSLLDEATAAAEAMTLCHRMYKGEGNVFFIDENCHPQTIEVCRTRAEPLGIEIHVGDHRTAEFADRASERGTFGVLLQYPGSDGRIDDLQPTIERAHAAGALCAACVDLLAMTLLKPPGEMGCDIACGSSQRFGVPLGYGGFMNMKALSRRNDEPARASRPFDRDRDGFVMSEGSGVLVLEEYEHARRRSARIYCELRGYASTTDAHHVTAPAPGGAGAARCMTLAMKRAGLAPEHVGYVNAHGTSTPANDVAETQAIRSAFGAHADRLMVSSTKGVTGHLLGAAGGIEAVATCLALYHGVIPPTANLEHPDPECDLDHVPLHAREVGVSAAVSNGFGFGGTNAVLAFGVI